MTGIDVELDASVRAQRVISVNSRAATFAVCSLIPASPSKPSSSLSSASGIAANSARFNHEHALLTVTLRAHGDVFAYAIDMAPADRPALVKKF